MDLIISDCPLYTESVEKYKSLKTKIGQFIRCKQDNPIQKFGTSDYPMSGPYKGLRHAHLSGDISIIYEMIGSNPHILKLYGLFSHEELGTGVPSKKRKQVQMTDKFKNQKF